MVSRAPSEITIMTYGILASTTGTQAVVPMIVPPDGGWGWVVVFVGITSTIVVDGMALCFFLFKEPMTEDLGLKSGDIPLLAGLFEGCYFLGGILACSIANHFGFRIVMVLSASITSLCFASGYFLQDILYFFILIGVIGGITSGSIYVAATLPCSFYFDKKRTIAMGLVSCGSGIGAVIIPQVNAMVMDHYGWRNTYLFDSLLYIIPIILGLLILPVKPVIVVIKQGSITSLNTVPLDTLQRQSVEYSLFQIPTSDAFSLGGRSSMGTTVLNQSDYPTISQMAQDTDVISIMVRGQSRQFDRLLEWNQLRDLQASLSMLVPTVTVEMAQTIQRLPWYKCGCFRSPHNMPEQPLLRTDLYYTGSLNRLDVYTSKGKDLDYHLQVTKVPTYFETIQDLTKTYTYWCCVNILRGFRSLLDYTLLKSLTFLCLAFSALAYYISFYLPYFYGQTRLDKIGMGDYATSLVSMIGIGSTMGRILSGIILTKIPRFGARTATMWTNIIAGLALLGATLHPNMLYQFGCMFIYGFTVGFFIPLRSIIIVDFMGLGKLTSATGIMILFEGMGAFMGAPLAEMVLNHTQNENSPFYVATAFLILAGVLLCPMRKISNWEKRRKLKK